MSNSSGVSTMRYYERAFALVTLGVLGWALWHLLTPFASPILWAAMLAFMLNPLKDRLLRRLRRPSLVSGLMTLTVFLVVAGPLALFGFAFLHQAAQLLARFQSEASERKLPALQLVLESRPVQLALEKTADFTALSNTEILQQASDAAQRALQQIASLGSVVVVGAFTVITQFLLTLFLLFFFLRDGAEMLMRVVRLVPLGKVRKVDLFNQLGGVTRAVVLGTLATALVQGTLLGIGFGIVGLPSPLVFAGVGALTSLIPIVGTSLVWVPAAVTLLAQGQSGGALILTLWCVILVAGSDNVVRPLIISGNSNASTLLVFLGLLGGVSFFGFAGIFMGPLVLTLAAALLRYADDFAPALSLPPTAPVEGPSPPPPAAPAAPPPAAPPTPAPAEAGPPAR